MNQPTHKFALGLLIGTAGFVFAGLGNVHGQGARQPAAILEDVENALSSQKSKAGQLETEMKTLVSERANLGKKLIATATAIKQREGQLTAGERRLVDLNLDDSAIRRRLARRRGALITMLAALQNLEKSPPPVLAVRPNDAIAAIRSAMLLSTVVPQIRAEADGLTRELRQLASLREEIDEEQRQIVINKGQLKSEQAVIQRLLDVKGKLASRNAKEIAAVRQRATALAREAVSLKDLLGRLESARKRAETAKAREFASAAARATVPPDEGPDGSTKKAKKAPSLKERRLAMASPDRIRSSISFASAKGKLSPPAQGDLVRGFGAPDSHGGKTKGVSFKTRVSAQVTSPAEGWVVYAGAFRGYGQLLIIDAGNGYHVLLAGIRNIDVSAGQLVLAGEPVGRMGRQAIVSAAIGAIKGDSSPVLYVEFRKDGNSINPQPWWSADNARAQG
ncbi:MAG: murein hydrolase activator EnvC family protein [Alphaproteobacteria bacterium]